MDTYFSALIPIMAIILLGYLLYRTRFLSDAAWAGMEKLTYFVLFPALLIKTLGQQNVQGMPWLPMLAVIALTLAGAALILVIWHRLRGVVSGATFTSIFQGGVRFNTYIALAVVDGLFGSAGLAIGSVAAGFMIVLINLACILAFIFWGHMTIKGVGGFIRQVVGNPLIFGCAIGWFLSLSGIGLPGLSVDILELISRATLPFGLLAVGAALRPRKIHGHLRPLLVSSMVQFGFKPLLLTLLLTPFGLSGVVAGVLIIFFISPTASSGYILARQLGGDTEAIASIITAQTLLAIVLMPLLAILLLG